jgi:hypothetical protein
MWRVPVRSLRAPSRLSFIQIWAVAAAILFGLCAAWSLSTPIGAANDEGAQVLRAVSVVRGQLLGQPLTAATQQTLDQQQLASFEGCTRWGVGVLGADQQAAAQRCAAPYTVVTVPKSFAAIPGSEFCNSFDPYPDTCPVHLDGSDRLVRAITYVGRYPPLYYAIVGLPSLVSRSDAAIYAMRLLSGALTASLIGLAIATAVTWSTRRMLLLAVTVVATPLLFVFGAVVNPSGLEMSAALCTWTGALILVLDHPERPPPGLVVACTAAATIFALARPLSVFWLALTLFFVALLRPRAVWTLGADRRVRIGGAVVAGASALALAWVAWAHSWSVLPVGRRVPAGAPLWRTSQLVIGSVEGWFHQFAGAFGWEVADPPPMGTALLVVALVSVLVVGLVLGERRQLAVLALLGAMAVVVPILLIASHAERNGIVWQTRDGYPLLCGVVLVAGSIGRLHSRRSAVRADGLAARAVKRFVLLLACCVAGMQFADLYWAIRALSGGTVGTARPPGPDKGRLHPTRAAGAPALRWVPRVHRLRLVDRDAGRSPESRVARHRRLHAVLGRPRSRRGALLRHGRQLVSSQPETLASRVPDILARQLRALKLAFQSVPVTRQAEPLSFCGEVARTKSTWP